MPVGNYFTNRGNVKYNLILTQYFKQFNEH